MDDQQEYDGTSNCNRIRIPSTLKSSVITQISEGYGTNVEDSPTPGVHADEIDPCTPPRLPTETTKDSMSSDLTEEELSPMRTHERTHDEPIAPMAEKVMSKELSAEGKGVEKPGRMRRLGSRLKRTMSKE